MSFVDRGINCITCGKRLGAAWEGPKALKCSVCLATAYCSLTCQKSDWKSHRTLCRTYTTQNNIAEEAALSRRAHTQLNTDLNPYLNYIATMYSIAARSAYHFGHPTSCQSTHNIELHFFYDPSGPTLPSRFRLVSADLLVHSELVKKYPYDPLSTHEAAHDVLRATAMGDGTGERAVHRDDFFDGVFLKVEWTDKVGGGILTMANPTSHPPWTYTFGGVKVKDRKLNPGWKKLLFEMLADPAPNVINYVGIDVCQSEGEEVGRRLIQIQKRLYPQVYRNPRAV